MKKLLLLGLLFSSSTLIHAQWKKPAPSGEAIETGRKNGLKTTLLAAEYVPGQTEENWMRSLTSKEISHDHDPAVEEIKEAKLEIKSNSELGVGNDRGGSRSVTPVVNTNFNGNQMNYGTPSDNDIAISNGGRIVAVDNDMIQYFTESGSSISNNYHDNFFSSLNLTSIIYDPRVIYDPVADRFIFVILHGYSSTTSKILVCFSKTNNPSNGWWIYQLSGNPLNNNCWTDYPNVAISNDEVFITGNLFTNNYYFNQSYIYQIGKAAGYNGSSLNYEVWDNIYDANSGNAFTIVPAEYGQDGSYGPGMYFVSARSQGFSGSIGRIYLYEITDNLAGNASLQVTGINVNGYSPAADAYQSGSSDLLDVGDCRMHHAMYLNGYVHGVHAGDYNNTGYSGINYYRIPVSQPNQTQQASLGLSGYDYTYPSLASFGLAECDKSVMIACLRSASTLYPEVRVVNCDENMNWSSSVTVTSGSGYVNMQSGMTERWGDYSGMSRKHNAVNPEVWLIGAYGNVSHRWQSRIAEVQGAYNPPDLPVVNFGSNVTEGEVNLFVNFYDSTVNNPIAWEWHFEGGVPSMSTAQNPLVAYPDSGYYDVTLIATNSYCSDSLKLTDFIHAYKIYRDTITILGVTIYVVGTDSFQMWDGELVPLGVDNSLTEINQPRIFPNPVADYEIMNLEMNLPEYAHVNVTIFNMSGQEVKLLFDDYLDKGEHQLNFNKLALPTGEYFVRVKSNDRVLRDEKIIVIH